MATAGQYGQRIDLALIQELGEEPSVVARTFSLWKAKEKTDTDATTRLYFDPVTFFDGLSSPCQGQKPARITVHGAAWYSFLPVGQEIPAALVACPLDEPGCSAAGSAVMDVVF